MLPCHSHQLLPLQISTQIPGPNDTAFGGVYTRWDLPPQRSAKLEHWTVHENFCQVVNGTANYDQSKCGNLSHGCQCLIYYRKCYFFLVLPKINSKLQAKQENLVKQVLHGSCSWQTQIGIKIYGWNYLWVMFTMFLVYLVAKINFEEHLLFVMFWVSLKGFLECLCNFFYLVTACHSRSHLIAIVLCVYTTMIKVIYGIFHLLGKENIKSWIAVWGGGGMLRWANM